VIGVEAGGRSRAYLLKAFFYPAARHVINDLLGGRPITIVYCDMTDYVAAYTDPDANEPLHIATRGWQGHSVPGQGCSALLQSLHQSSGACDPTPNLELDLREPSAGKGVPSHGTVGRKLGAGGSRAVPSRAPQSIKFIHRTRLAASSAGQEEGDSCLAS
jgi:hypothetical protein